MSQALRRTQQKEDPAKLRVPSVEGRFAGMYAAARVLQVFGGVSAIGAVLIAGYMLLSPPYISPVSGRQVQAFDPGTAIVIGISGLTSGLLIYIIGGAAVVHIEREQHDRENQLILLALLRQRQREQSPGDQFSERG